MVKSISLNAPVPDLSDIFWWQGLGPYSTSIKKAEKEIKELAKKVNDLCGMFVKKKKINGVWTLLTKPSQFRVITNYHYYMLFWAVML